MKRLLIALYFVAGLAASSVFGADPRYTLTEYSMNGCGACVAALKDVAELTSAGVDVRCVNTSVDPIGEAEAWRYNLRLRPAWRLANAQGVEIGRWYGAGKAGLVLATIRAKFPTPDAEEPIGVPLAEVEEEAPDETLETIDVIPPELAPSALAELDALKDEAEEEEDAEEDFRDRKTVSEPFLDSSFLDKSLDEWNRRGEDDDAEDDDAEEEFEDEEESQGGFFSPKTPNQGENESEAERARLGERLADRVASKLLYGLLPPLDDFKDDALRKLDYIGANVASETARVALESVETAKIELLDRVSKETASFRIALFEEIEALAFRVLKWFAVMIVAAVVGFYLTLRLALKAGAR